MKHNLLKLTTLLMIVVICHSTRLIRRKKLINSLFVDALEKIGYTNPVAIDKKEKFPKIVKVENEQGKKFIAKYLSLIGYGKEKKKRNAETEKATFEEIKNFRFSLPLCASTEVVKDSDPKAMVLIIPYVEKDLDLEIVYYIAEYYEEDNKIISDEEKFVDKLKQIIQLALGMREFHKAKLIHRKINVMNYLVMEDGRIVLTEFGNVLKQTENIAEITRRHDPVDQRIYTAPEIKDHPADYSGKGDMYSLGMTIALLIIPELYNCINELAEDCTVKNFHHNFRWESGIVYQSVKEFREALEQVRISKEVSVSELQKKVEDVVFGKLLVDASQRLTSKMLKKELKALTPEIYSEVKEQYKEKVDYCK